jgi:hypothetical protein
MGVRRVVGCMNKEQRQKTGLYIIKYKGNMERMVRNWESELETNVGN